MANDTFDLVLIQDPNNIPQRLLDYNPKIHDHPADYLNALKSYFRQGVTIGNMNEFCGRIFAEVSLRKRLIKNLVIGAHGGYEDGKYEGGHFYIGSTVITSGIGSRNEHALLRRVAPFLSRDAHVYILACRTGNDRSVLSKVSECLGGIPVHGYTNYITTTSFGPYYTALDDGTGDGGKEVVCINGQCHFR
ncbi:hypothetical protein F183_A37580 [Bryobacterales bacterium F-183]|nr:hypothetical protein F183_A37580 [Bryobacterales bacterium F-183]